MITSTDILYAQKLRSIRMVKLLKQEDAAKLIGIQSQQEYSKLETGKTHFTDELIHKICNSFNISLEDFTNSNMYNNICNNTNFQHNVVNDTEIIKLLIKSKEEMIELLKKQNELLEKALHNKLN